VGALDGIKLLDFSWSVAGPLTSRYFSTFGADVIRVESALRPDVIRRTIPIVGKSKGGDPGPNRSAFYAMCNTDKRSITLNLKHPKGRDLALRLGAWADIVLESFTPGTMEEWGLGYEAFNEVNPRVVMLSTSMLGRGGPKSTQPGFGNVLTALSGLTWLTGWPDGGPTPPYGPYTDFISPKFAVPALLAALDRRDRTGKGMYLDLSQFETTLYFAGPQILDYQVNQHLPARQGNSDPGAAPHGVYPCRGDDRWIAIACATGEQWQRLCDVMGRPALSSEERFSTFHARKANEAELNDLLATWTRRRSAPRLTSLLQGAGVPAYPVQNARDVFHDPQLGARGHFVPLDHPEIGLHYAPAAEFRLARSSSRPARRSPLLGEHTSEVLKGVLGLGQSEIDALRQERVLD